MLFPRPLFSHPDVSASAKNTNTTSFKTVTAHEMERADFFAAASRDEREKAEGAKVRRFFFPVHSSARGKVIWETRLVHSLVPLPGFCG